MSYFSARSPLAALKSVMPQDLKNTPCVLVASQSQQETEQEYYHDIVGFREDFLFAENLEEARLMIISGKGFMPVEGMGMTQSFGTSISRIPLYRGEEQMKRNYCAFWKKDNSGSYYRGFCRYTKGSVCVMDFT